MQSKLAAELAQCTDSVATVLIRLQTGSGRHLFNNNMLRLRPSHPGPSS